MMIKENSYLIQSKYVHMEQAESYYVKKMKLNVIV